MSDSNSPRLDRCGITDGRSAAKGAEHDDGAGRRTRRAQTKVRTPTPFVGLQRRVTPPPHTPTATAGDRAQTATHRPCSLSCPLPRRRRRALRRPGEPPAVAERDRAGTAVPDWRRGPPAGAPGRGTASESDTRRKIRERGRCNRWTLSRKGHRAGRRGEAQDTPNSDQRENAGVLCRPAAAGSTARGQRSPNGDLGAGATRTKPPPPRGPPAGARTRGRARLGRHRAARVRR